MKVFRKLWMSARRGDKSQVKEIIAGLTIADIDSLTRTIEDFQAELDDAREWLVKPERARLRPWNEGLVGYNRRPGEA